MYGRFLSNTPPQGLIIANADPSVVWLNNCIY